MRPLHILAVDDDPLIGLTISAFAARLGHTCQHSLSGEAALQLYAEQNFDLVLVDRIMPGLDGLQTTQHLRELQEQQGWRPIIMLSGASDIDEQVLALNSGCDDFLTKPINFSILEAKINAFWRIADMQQQIARQHRGDADNDKHDLGQFAEAEGDKQNGQDRQWRHHRQHRQ